MIRKLIQEPFIHFLLLGGITFLVWNFLKPEPPELEPEKPTITISESRIDNLIDIWTKTRQRPPTATELNGMVDDFLKEEVFYREALALGLDDDDVIVRRRMRQKMEMFVEDLASSAKPADEVLEKYLLENPSSFRVDRKFSIEQVYINPDKHPNDLKQYLAQLKKDLIAGEDASELGDSLLLQASYQDVSTTQLDLDFGQEFGQQVDALEQGKWSDPLSSGYGLHLVKVVSKSDGRIPTLEEIRPQVEREWLAKVRAEAKQEFYEKLKQKYEISFQLPVAEVDAN